MKPEVTLHRCQSSSVVVLELCTELEHLAHSCRNMEGRASLACAEVALSHVMHAPQSWQLLSHCRAYTILTHPCLPNAFDCILSPRDLHAQTPLALYCCDLMSTLSCL